MKESITFRNGNYEGETIKAGEHNTYLVLVNGEQIGYVGGISYPHESGHWMGYYLDDAGRRVYARATHGWDRPYFATRRRAAEAMIHRLGL